MIKCSSCGIEKPKDQFYKNRKQCKSCKDAQYKKWKAENVDKLKQYNKKRSADPAHKNSVSKRRAELRRQNKEYREAEVKNGRKSQLKRSFGICEQDYSTLLAEQQGVCAICGKEETVTRLGRIRALCIDHSHKEPFNIRGLLCSKCNTGLASFGDDESAIPVILKAIEYLKKTKPGNP